MVFVTGDLHGNFERFKPKYFPEQARMTKQDIMICAGDFGGVWFGDSRDDETLDRLERLPFTLAFVCGNHENYDALERYPVAEWHGGKVHRIRPHVLHLMRGQIFELDGYHQSPYPVGEGGYRWFTFVYDFQVTFFRDFSAENLGNILLFLPFGVLYPLFRRGSTWKRTLLMGVLTSLLIENIQPLMDRSFDLNDVVLNAVGVAISTFLFYTLRHLLGKQHR